MSKKDIDSIMGPLLRSIKERMLLADDQSLAHRFDHLQRVCDRCLMIADRVEKEYHVSLDRKVLALAALLHDIDQPYNDKKNHTARSQKKAEEILISIDCEANEIRKVVDVIGEHSSEDSHPPESWEGKILYDADKLDGIGPIGIARVFTLCGQMGLTPDQAAAWYRRKIEKALPMMQTTIARELGRKDYLYTLGFLDRFDRAMGRGTTIEDVHIRSLTQGDKEVVAHIIQREWHSPIIITRGVPHDIRELSGFIALSDDGMLENEKAGKDFGGVNIAVTTGREAIDGERREVNEECEGDVTGREAIDGEKVVGLATYEMNNYQCELITFNSFLPGFGIGSRLIECVEETARNAGCSRLWLITTNDNSNAIEFYQKRGFSLVAVHRNALHRTRKIKPELPEIGMNGIPFRDEIEMEFVFGLKDVGDG